MSNVRRLNNCLLVGMGKLVRMGKPIFISYAKEDRVAALAVFELLQTNGLQAWIDVHELLPGQEWESEIDAAIRGSKAFIACMSTASVSKRGFVQSELRRALKTLETISAGQIYLIPVRLDDCDVPSQLGHLHWVDYFGPDGPVKLLASIRRTLGIEAEFSIKSPLTHGIAFTNITLDRSNPNWQETRKPEDRWYEFDRECAHYFQQEFVEGDDASPSFDITLLNLADDPILLTAVGLEIVSIAHQTFVAGIPEAAKVFRTDAYRLEMPDLRARLSERFQVAVGVERLLLRDFTQRELNELVSLVMPDPVYLAPKAPYRYGIFLVGYATRIPNRVITRLFAKTSAGETKSKEIYLASR